MKIRIDNLEQTKALAEKISELTENGDVVELNGDLGSGKTTFAKFFINNLLPKKEEVLSPTFNLVHQYEANNFVIWHFDLYRLENEREAEEIGIYDAFEEGVSLIEWSEIISGIVPENRLLIIFASNNSCREVTIKPFGNWENKLKESNFNKYYGVEND